MHLRLIFIISLVISNSALAQIRNAKEKTSPVNIPKPNVIFHQKPGNSYAAPAAFDSLRAVHTDMTEMTDIIVEYKDEPMFIQQKENRLRKINAQAFQARQAKFSGDLANIYESANKAFSQRLGLPVKKNEYFKVFYGSSLRVPKAMITEIASLPYVKKVHPDKTVKADLAESVRLIKADSVWNKFGDQGDSVVVGVIDSGIDYMHPALGGGIGRGFKVTGGYDFVNKDNDPMDDRGHGTHVAGIIAANSEGLKGIAPKALLMAIKVLNADGQGTESDILSGIEMAADPNGDNNPDDRLDVVNMSLGNNSGNPFDAMSAAVNNAVKLGITVCVSAGNSGDFETYSSIGSPACAELAITVGASDKYDRPAEFSSKGPVKRTFIMKPEILAPGVEINSSYLGGTTGIHSGTSMSSPMIAGVCALIKHKHRSWTPEMIKSALMSTAIDLGLDPMVQGAGRISAIKAVSASSFSIPSQLNFGLDSLGTDLYERTDTLKVINQSAITQFYQVTISNLPQGLTLSAGRNSFSLLPGEAGYVLIKLTADNRILLNGKEPTYSYSGKVIISGTLDELIIPWTFVKSPVLILSCDRFIDFYNIFNGTDSYYFYSGMKSGDLYTDVQFLPEGRYNILLNLTGTSSGGPEKYMILKEGLDINKANNVFISYKEADKAISFNGVDEAGRKINSLYKPVSNITFMNKYSGYYDPYFSIILKDNETLKSSAMPDYISLYAGQFQNDTEGEHKVRIVNFPSVKGVKGDVEFTNQPAEFLKQNIRVTIPAEPEGAAVLFTNGVSDMLSRFPGCWFNYTNSAPIREKVWEGALFLNEPADSGFSYNTNLVCIDTTNFRQIYLTELFRAKSGGVMCFDMDDRPDVFHSWNNGAMNFGDGPVYPTWFNLGAPLSSLTPSGIRINTTPTVYGQLKELRMFDMDHSVYTVYDEKNNVIKQETLEDFRPFELPGGKYKYELKDNSYTAAGRFGKATLLRDIDENNTYPKSPEITSLRVLNSSGIPVSMLKRGDKGIISFSFITAKGLPDTAETRLYLKEHGKQDWEEIRISKRTTDSYLGLISSAEIGKYAEADSSLIDMKIVSQNLGKLKTEWKLEPAFAVGNYNYTSADDETGGGRLKAVPGNYVLYNNYPNPFNPTTTISYSIPRESMVELRVYDMLGREVSTLVNKKQSAGEYRVQFNASSLPSGVYIYSIQAGGFRDSRKLMLVK